MKEYRIGAATKLLGLSADTSRYYEKINLLPLVDCTSREFFVK